MLNILNKLRGDKVIWTVVIILSVFSILAVYSSTGTLAYKKQGGNTEFYLIRHFFIILLGFIFIYLAHLVKHTYYSRISQIALIISIPLLLLTLIIGTNYQASRWLTLPGINVSFQTSDFAKLALIMYLSRVLSKKQGQITNFKSVFLTIMLPILIVCGLILPANFSTSAMLFIICIIIMFIGKVNIKYILYLVTISAASFFLYVTILSNLSEGKQDRLPTWESRWQSFKNKSNEPGGQVEQAKIAIATGGLFGKSPGKSTQRNFLPYAYSDFIFAIIIEEYGLIGGIVLILMYLILLFRGIKIATKTPRYFGTFLTMGCCFSLVFQAFINVAVAVNILPVTGQTLPFVSMGGTSILFMSITVGIMLSVSKETEKKLKPAIINEISKSKDN
jgi:cell division protein FtsW